jgi:hypothetical protein
MTQALCAHMNDKRKKNTAGGLAQAVECLPSKCKALSSITSTNKEEKKKKWCCSKSCFSICFWDEDSRI